MSENENKTIPNDKIKSDKKPNVPNLRFNDNIWKKYQFSEIYEITNGINKDKESFGYGFPIVNYMDVNKNTFISRELIQGKVNSLPNERVIYSVTPSDILLTRTSETKEEIAYASCLLEPVDNCVFSGFLLRARPKNNENIPIFIAYLLRSKKYRNELMKLSTMTSRALINSDNLGKLQIKIPNKETQIKISKFLTTIDKRITTQSKIIEVLKSQKKWIYDTVFNKIDAEIVPLGNLCNIKKGEQINGSELNDNDIYPFMNGGTSPSGYFHMFNANENTISISEGGNSCGYIQFNKNKFWCGGHCYSLINIKEQVNNKYLYHFLKANELNIMRLRVGSGLPNIQKKDLENFSIFIPSLKEQNFIANFLDICDLKINLEEVLLIKLKEQKKYLLSNMFI